MKLVELTSKSNKDILAKLMATENITVLHKKVPTAYFDVKDRTLVCPMFKEMSPELYDLFMGHEVSHALNTPLEGWHEEVCEKGPLFKGYLNVIEDVRIEKKIKERYPGLRRSFYKGYDELANEDFFGIKENTNKELNEKNLIDKINIHFKIGHLARVRFSDDEKPYIKRCKNLETFEEVLELANELFERQKEKTNEKLESMTQWEIEELMDDLEISEEEEISSPAESESIPIEDDYPSDEQIPSNHSNDESDDFEEEFNEQEENSEDGENSDEENLEDGEGGGEENSEQKGGGKSKEEKLEDELNKSETDEEFRSNEGSLLSDKGEGDEPKYYEIENKIQYDNFIIPWKEIDKKVSDKGYYNKPLNRTNIEKFTKEFVNKNKRIINYMVKEFEMKKAAAAYKRSQSAKTGELNMDRLHLYKLKDDIFNRIQVIPEGKNHGVVMVIDWSGSMSGSVKPTMEQAALLSMFCRRIQIPFRLFAFSDSYRSDKALDLLENENKNNTERNLDWNEYIDSRMYGKKVEQENPWNLGSFNLLEIFNEKMSNTEFIRNMENWFEISNHVDWRNSYEDQQSYDRNWYLPGGLNLGGTPLDASIVVLRDYLKDFKRNYGLDICSFIALTDGESHSPFSHSDAYLVDRKINKVFKLTEGWRGRNTHGLLKWLKETADVKTIGFFLTTAVGRRWFYDAGSFTGQDIDSYNDDDIEKRKEFTKLATTFKDGAYDLAIMINQKKIEINYKKDDLDYVLGGQTMETGVTKGKLKSALVKAGNHKMKQRVILNQFVDQMAV